MIRKLVLAAVLATGVVAGVATTATTAEAAQPFEHDRHDVRFEVQVRHHGHWNTYETFRNRDDAQRVAHRLECEGRDVRIEVERDRR